MSHSELGHEGVQLEIRVLLKFQSITVVRVMQEVKVMENRDLAESGDS